MLQRSVEYFIEDRFVLSHPVIVNQDDKSLEELIKIAESRNVLIFFLLICEFWNKMVEEGEVFDSTTWKLK